MKTNILFFLSFIVLFGYSQTAIRDSYSKLSSGKIKTGDEFILTVNYCFNNPQHPSSCPFCECGLLDTLGYILKTNPNYHIEISVNTDFRGTNKNNFKLSTGKAISIKNYLEKIGIDPKKITAKGLGEDNLYVFKSDTIIDNISIKKGTIDNEDYSKTIQSRELREKLISFNRRILIKFILTK